MTEGYWLRSAKGSRRYLALGRRPGRLYGDLDYLPGFRGLLERNVLRLPHSVVTAGSVEDPEPLSALEEVAHLIAPKAALLLWTGYYKPTIAVGPIETNDAGRLFIKVFRDPQEASLEVTRTRSLAPILSASMRIADADRRSERTVAYDVLARGKQRLGLTQLIECALTLGTTAVHGEVVDGALPHDLAEIRAEISHCGGWRASERWVRDVVAAADRPQVLAHGDLTPWNAFLDPAGRVCLIDYEEVGYWPQYFDLIHLIAQTHVERGKVPNMQFAVDGLKSIGVRDATPIVRDALAHDLLRTVRERLRFPSNQSRSAAAVRLKLAAIEQAS